MSKLKKIAENPDAGRVRVRMLDDLRATVKAHMSELENYGHCFTKKEGLLLMEVIRYSARLAKRLDKNEDKRVALNR